MRGVRAPPVRRGRAVAVRVGRAQSELRRAGAIAVVAAAVPVPTAAVPVSTLPVTGAALPRRTVSHGALAQPSIARAATLGRVRQPTL